MVPDANPEIAEEKLAPLRLLAFACVPEPLGKPFVVLYSIPYGEMMVPHAVVADPANVAEFIVIKLAAPVVTAGSGLIPAPVTASLTEVAPPPPTGIFPL